MHTKIRINITILCFSLYQLSVWEIACASLWRNNSLVSSPLWLNHLWTLFESALVKDRIVPFLTTECHQRLISLVLFFTTIYQPQLFKHCWIYMKGMSGRCYAETPQWNILFDQNKYNYKIYREYLIHSCMITNKRDQSHSITHYNLFDQWPRVTWRGNFKTIMLKYMMFPVLLFLWIWTLYS